MGYMELEGSSFVPSNDPPRFTGRPTPFSGIQMLQVRSQLQKAEKHLHIRHIKYVFLRADSLPK